VSRQIEKIRTKGKSKEDYGYDNDVYEQRVKKKNKHERTELRRLKNEEYSEYLYGDMKRIR
jgi:hypothetical protein